MPLTVLALILNNSPDPEQQPAASTISRINTVDCTKPRHYINSTTTLFSDLQIEFPNAHAQRTFPPVFATRFREYVQQEGGSPD